MCKDKGQGSLLKFMLGFLLYALPYFVILLSDGLEIGIQTGVEVRGLRAGDIFL